MSEEDLQQRVSQLEETVFGNNSNSDQTEKNREKIGYLQNKLRDAGEKVQEIESSISSLETEIDHLESEEELKEEMKQEVRRLKKKRKEILNEFERREKELVNEVDDKLDQVESVQNNVERLIDSVDDQLDRYDEVTDEMFYQIIETAKFTSQFTVNSFRMSQTLSQVMLKEYLPNCELSEDYWKVLFSQHEVPLEKTQFLNDSLEGWCAIVQKIRDDDLDYFNPIEDKRLFEAFLLTQKMLIDMEYHGIEESKSQSKYYGDKDPEALEEVFDELGLDLDQSAEESERTDPSNKYYIAELFVIAISDNVDSEKGARNFVDEFQECQSPESIVEHLTLAGLDETLIDDIDEEKLKEFTKDVETAGLEDIEGDQVEE